MTISAKMDQRLITLSFTRFVTSCLTRIRLELAIYFCLHRGSLLENNASWQAFSQQARRSVSSPDESPNSVVRHVLSTVALIFRGMAYVPVRFPNNCNDR